jgi:hypothetical protein
VTHYRSEIVIKAPLVWRARELCDGPTTCR